MFTRSTNARALNAVCVTLVSCLDNLVSCDSFLVSNGVSCRRCHGQLLLGCRTTWARKKSLTGSAGREGLMVESASNDPCLGIPREPEFLDGEIGRASSRARVFDMTGQGSKPAYVIVTGMMRWC